MSTTIDNRVVQMRFDNEEFEKKAGKSLSTLDKLKNALKFSGASKDIDKVNKSFKEVDTNPLLNAINGINSGFTTMVAKATLVNRATNALIDTTKRFVNNMTLDQVNAGWDKYAEKTSAVQTIMAATSKDFKDTAVQMSYVNNQLEKLNWFTDETSYNFTDMVGNIGKFTSNGIKLDKSVTAMQGIALWAARSGANADEASRAMYNLSQALSTGAVKLIDWKSIENANMATAEFKENVLEVAANLGKLKKAGDGTYTTMKNNAVSVNNFNDVLADNAFTSDVLLEVLDRYGSFTNKLYEVSEATDLTATQLLIAIDDYANGTLNLEAYASQTGVSIEELRGYLDELSDSTYELGRKSFQTGQEAKTFGEAISSATDAISTGWMKTFELIFGDYQEAKKLWTNLANIMYEIFAASGDVRNELFGDWRAGGGRKTLIEGINNAMEAAIRLVKPFKDAFRDIFPAKTGEDLLKATDRFKALMEALQLSTKSMTNIRRAMRGVFSVIKIVITLFKQLGEAIKNAVAPQFASFGELVLSIFGTIGDLLYILSQSISEMNLLGKGFEWAKSAGGKFLNVISSIISKFKEGDAGKVLLKMVSTAFESAAKSGEKLFNYIANVVKEIRSLDHITFANLIGIFQKIGSDAWNWFKELGKSITNGNGLVEKFRDSVKDACEKTGASFDHLARRVGKVFEVIKGYLQKVPWGALISIAFGLKIIATINNFTKTMTAFATALGNLTKGLGGLADGVNKVMTSVSKMFDAVTASINAPNYVKMAKALAILAGSLAILALLPTDKLEHAAVVLVGVMTSFAFFVKALTLIPTLADTAAATIGTFGAVILALTASLLILVNAFKTLEGIQPDALLANVISIGILLGIITAAVTIMSGKLGPLTMAAGKTSVLNTAAANIVAMALAIGIIAKSLATLSKISFKDINSATNAVGLSIIAIGSMIFMLSKFHISGTLKSSASILLVIVSFGAILRSIQKLEDYRIYNVWKVIKNLSVLLVALAGLFAVSRIAGENAGKIGVMLAGIGLGILALSSAIALLGNFRTETLIKGIAAVGALSVFMVALIGISKLAGKESHKVALMILAVTAGISALAVVAGIIGNLSTEAMWQGVGFVAALSAIFIALIGVSALSKDASKTITTMTIAVVALGSMVAALSIAVGENPEVFKKIAEGLDGLMICMGIMSILLRFSKIDTGAFVRVLVAFGGLGALLGLLLSLAPNLDKAIEVAVAIGILSVALGAIATVLPALQLVGAAAKEAFVGVAVALVAIVGVVAVIGLVLTAIQLLGEHISPKLPEYCKLIGDSLGALVYGFVENGIATSIVVLGEALANFMHAFDGVNFEDVGVATAAVVAFCADLTAIKLQQLFDLFTGGPADLTKFGDNLYDLGWAIESYGRGLGDADMDKISASVPAVTALVLISNLIPRSGGIWQAFAGDKDFGALGDQLGDFGKGLSKYSDKLAECDISRIEASLPAVRALVEIADMIPNGGGFITVFTGDNTFAGFGLNLVAFGAGLVGYSTELIACNFDRIEESIDPVKALVKIADLIPNGGGLITVFTGDNTFASFGLNLATFGAALAGYSIELLACNFSRIEESIAATEALVKIADMIPNGGGLIAAFTGDNTFANFGVNLLCYGSGLKNYYESVDGIDFDVIEDSVAATEALVKIADAIPTTGGVVSWFAGDNDFADFGDNLEDFGESMAKYYDALDGVHISPTATSIIIDDVEELTGLIDIVGDKNLSKVVDFGYDLEDFGDSLYDFFSNTKDIEKPTSLDNLCDSVLASVTILESYIPRFKTAGQDCVAGFLEGVSEQEELTKVADAAEAVGNTFLNRFRKVTGWGSPWKSMIEAGKDSGSGLLVGASNNPDAAEAGAELSNTFLNGFNDVIGRHSEPDEFIDVPHDCADALNTGADEAKDELENAGEATAAAYLTGAAKKLSDGFSKIKQSIGSSLSNVADEYGIFGDKDNIFTKMAGFLFGTDETESPIDDITSTLEDTIGSATSGALESFSGSGTTAADAFLTAFEDRLSDLDLDLSTIDLEQELWEATIGKNASDSEKNARETAILTEKIKIQNEKVDQANQKYEYTIKKFGENSEDAKKAYQSLLQEQIDLANLMTSLDESRNTVENNSADTMRAYAEWIAESKDDLLKLGFTMEQISAAASERTGYNLKNTTDTMTDSVTNAVSTAMGTVSTTYLATAESTLGALTTNFESYGAQYATSVGNGMTATTSAVTAGAKALTNAGTTQVSQDYSQWYNLGGMCAEGFKQGILDKAKEIAEAARAVAAAVFAAVQVEVDAHSPSRKFMWLGEMCGLGMSIGFQNMEGSVARSATAVSEETINAARDTIGQLADLIDTDPTLHPQISPIVDLSDVHSGFSKIGAMKTPVISTYVSGARANAIAASLSSRTNGITQSAPQNNQNEPQVIEFVQNNYSPKALSRSEIYRNTNNQFTAFKEAISKV